MFAFENSYARLPAQFYARLAPTPVSAPQLLRVNVSLATQLGLDPATLITPEAIAIYAGNYVPKGAAPLAMAYAGHQFGNFVPQLGDGRAILLGEIIGRDGVRRDLQLKGSGRTPFSRNGDGRAAIGPVLREYIIGEAMAALGIPTTRVLAAVASGDYVARDAYLPGAVLLRVAQSHLRVGTFEFFASRQDSDALRQLADYAIQRHDPHLADRPDRYLAFFAAVVARQARLIAQWLSVGFIHGVMNTDNMTISGETLDYGPCAFLDVYDPDKVFSSIDRQGRYAFANQPRIAHWNLARLAEALMPLFDSDTDKAVALAKSALDEFPPAFSEAYEAALRAKLGLKRRMPGDAELAQDLLDRMALNKADFTLTFRALAKAAQADDTDTRTLFADPTSFDAWASRWRDRLALEPHTPVEIAAAMNAVNPKYIARNHQVEAALAVAQNHGDLNPLDDLLRVLATPFNDQPSQDRYAAPPTASEIVQATFCGT